MTTFVSKDHSQILIIIGWYSHVGFDWLRWGCIDMASLGWIGLNWIGLDWLGLDFDFIRLGCVGLGWIRSGMGKVGLD